MRVMMGLVIAMGVLIVAGTAVVAITIVGRMAPHTAAAAQTLDEPAGTHIAGIAPIGNRMAIVLQGGGPDRVVLVAPGAVRLRQ